METVHEVNPEYAFAVIVGVIATALLVWWGWNPIQNYIKGQAMKQKRREEIHVLLTGGFVDFIIDCVADEDITPAEAESEGYAVLRRLYPKVKEIAPDADWLRERIERRLRAEVHEPIPVPLPDGVVIAKDAEVKVVTSSAKNMLAKG